MATKALFALCALVLVQSAFSCACGGGISIGRGCGGVSSTGGNFPTSSVSAQPNGLSVISDNKYEGELCLGGNLPFLGTVALEGVLPTRGTSQVSYGCGNGKVGITSEQGVSTGITNPGLYQPGPGALRCGCGCGRL